MRVGASLLLMAIGAGVTFGLSADVNGFSLGAFGAVLIVVGFAGMLIAGSMRSPRGADIRNPRPGLSRSEPADWVADHYFV